MNSDAVRPPKNPDGNIANHPSSKVVRSGTLLFVDRLLTNIGNWLFWFVISKFTVTSEIGEATTISSLVMLVCLITQLGLEYPLLKLSSSNRSTIFGTALTIKTVATLASVPIMIFIVTNFYGYPFQHEFLWIAVATALVSSISYIARFVLLGISSVKYVLVFEVIGTILKFLSGYALVSLGYGALGILIAFLCSTLATSIGLFIVARKSFQFKLGDRKFFKQITTEGLLNTPSKLSKLFIANLSVVLLASMAVSSDDIGTFYIALMISIAVTSFAGSLAFMVIPASMDAKKDLTVISTRIGLSLTVPFITAIMVSPNSILAAVGQEYVAAGDALFILGIGILPFMISLNAISQLNTIEGKSKRVLVIGIIQFVAFLVPFTILVPQYGTFGAAYSILTAYIASAIPSAIWLGRKSMKHILFSIIAIFMGWAVGGELGIKVADIHPIAGIVIGSVLSFGIILSLKNTSLNEIKQIVKLVRSR